MDSRILNKLVAASTLCFVVQIFFMSNSALAGQEGCPEVNFLFCVTKLRLQRVPFDQNMLNVVFNVTTEAKLRQTCVAYTDALPCFRDKILQCGNDKQKQLLDEVAKMIQFFCSANSTKRQDFLKHGPCIGKVLQMPATTDCYSQDHQEYAKIDQCRKICYDKREFLCMMKIWVSEQNFCTLLDIERNCNNEAGIFYQQLQTNVFSESFPIICDYSLKAGGQIVSSDSTFVDSVVDPRAFFENANKPNGVPHMDQPAIPTLPSSIPVVYEPKTRPTEPLPVKLPTYIPVNPSWQNPEIDNYNVVEITVTVTEPSGQPNLWMPPLKKGVEDKYPFDHPFPDSTQVRLTTPAQWKPWYLGGSPNGTQGMTESLSQRKRLAVADDEKSSLWDSLSMSNIFEFGQQILQNTNKIMTRKDADASYRNSLWPFNGSNKNNSNGYKFLIVLIIVPVWLFY